MAGFNMAKELYSRQIQAEKQKRVAAARRAVATRKARQMAA